MKDKILASLSVYLTSVAASVSSLYIFNEYIKSRQISSPTPTSTLEWKPLGNREIQNIRFIINNKKYQR